MSRRPSAAMVVGVLALCFALVGTAVAADPTAKLTRAKVRKIANQEIDKRAPGLSVAKAVDADRATTATGVAANGVHTAAIQDNAVTGAKVNEATLNLGLTRVLGTPSANNSVSPKSSTATCPAGSKVVGTGWINDGGANAGDSTLKEILADEVVPNGALTSVTVDTYETDNTTENWTTQAIAICAAVAG